MKNIVIRKLTLLNFKGVRNLDIDFTNYTTITGRNGSGKTTIFDAFTWLLFGKDSKDRKDFNIKTLDSNNKPIERIPHEVSAILCVNGENITLKKCYSEVWAKRRGSAVETFNGHSVECFYNDVPCSVTEYSRKVADICDEQVFKLITNPLFFCSQKKDFQRTMLYQLAGDITNEDVVTSHPELATLVSKLSGKTLEELKKEISAKKRKIKDGIETIPARIDERKRDMPEEQDWDGIVQANDALTKRVEDIDAQIADRSKAYNEITKQRNETARELAEVQRDITQRECEIRNEYLSEFYKKQNDKNNLIKRAENLQSERRFKSFDLARAESSLAYANEQREALLSEWKTIRDSSIDLENEEFVCPTCRRELPEDDIEAKKEQMIASFNAEKSKLLESNKTKGLAVKANIDALQAEIKSINDAIFRIDEEYARLINSTLYNENLEEPSLPDGDELLTALRLKELELSMRLREPVEAPDTGDLKDERAEIFKVIMANKVVLQDRERITANLKRISELEQEYRESQSMLVDLEGVEYSIQQFSKAKNEQVEMRINNLFEQVKFKLFDTQLNGGEIETCEAMINGVPYSDLNSAARINAGLDIINAISKKQGIKAPIFIDNRESVTNIVATLAQVINLSVADTNLIIQNE